MINKQIVIKAVSTALLLSATSVVHSANWLMLQGTEPQGAAERAKVWGFIQPEYQQTDGTKLQAGPWSGQNAQFNLIAPQRQTDSTFNIRRARLGVRGTGFPLDSKVNYFLLAEMGNNGITRPGGGNGAVRLTDASITLNHIPGARIRVGQFKTPTAEEGLQAIHVFDYVNFTNVTGQLMMERFFNGDGADTFVTPAGDSGPGGDPNLANGPVSAFRDIGIQVFDTFKVSDWEHSYAVMIGNGNGIARSDNDDNKDIYLYWSSELIYGGKGPRRDSLKLFVWNQDGKRTLTTSGAGEYDRTRTGVGVTFRKAKYRAAAEYIEGEGMIQNGTDGGAKPGSASNVSGTTASVNVATNGEADGYYLHFGYAVLPKLELDIRYDVYNRVTNVAVAERTFDTTTLGAQYFFNKKTRATINYEIRNAEAPNLPSSAPPNQILDGIDDLLSLQLITIF